ncbi:acyl-CoA thioesterase [Frankia sp. AgKG'84/4]|uniref:acyl-CoA thioesterase n=1 Tax=Frankia sp. AgKG'84/4 TaxID=573490 RepID=UPI00200ECA8C|nr:acyl-CoA thioesterase domain-containing protein [Frankia sp. AgKG'84/4]MCL9793509.1 thioesterase family protein [Frankia sp. AgKG'84/4]
MAFSVAAVLETLVLEPVGPDRYRAGSLPVEHGVVFGGQLLAQALVAARVGHEDKVVKTLHTVFARTARPDVALDIIVTRVHQGRALASSTVTIQQGERVCAESVALLSVDEPDFIRHADTPPATLVPPAGKGPDGGGWQVEIDGGADINDPAAVGPPDLDVWSRWTGAPDDPGISQALVAFATDGFLIGTAMRPHEGVGQAQAHVTVSTGVLSHTLTFHEPCHAGEWTLLAHHSSYAGRGRAYGRADVFRAGGDLVASFVQDSMIRPATQGVPRRL